MPDLKAPQTSDELAAALISMLGLDAAAKPADVLAALTDKLAETELKKTPEDPAKMLSAPALIALGAKIDAQGAELKALSATIDEAARREIVNGAIAAGKQVPTIAKTLPLGELRTLCAELPVTVPMDKRTPTEEALLLTSGLNSDSPAAAAVSSMTGVSDEDRKKYAAR